MMIAFRRRLCGAFALTTTLVTFHAVHAQVTEPVTALDRQLARTDLAIDGAGEFTTNTAGLNYLGQQAALQPSNTLGALVTLRYEASPLKGVELNFGYARFSENFTVSNTTYSPLGVQTNVTEYSLGYLAHARVPYFGVRPFASAGAGALDFKPTPGGGQGLPKQVRLALYYSIGVDSPLISEHFGARLAFRQIFYGAPDFDTNYLAAGQRSSTSQPYFGFFARF